MAATFCSLLTAHLLGEFFNGLKWFGERLRAPWRVIARAFAVALLSCVLLGNAHWGIAICVIAVAAVTGGVQSRNSDSASWFIASHAIALLAFLGIACRFPDAAAQGWWVSVAPASAKYYFAALSCLSGLMACAPAGGTLIANAMKPFTDEIRDANIAGLARGGRYIGWLERILVFQLIMIDQPSGIGFLIAAKSILRFAEIRERDQRVVAEYIIIGTFLSFGWGLFISVLTKNAIRYWIH